MTKEKILQRITLDKGEVEKFEIEYGGNKARKHRGEGGMKGFHDYEVVMPLDDGRFRTCKWSKDNEEGYETPNDQYEAVLDLVRGCRFSDTEYYVFKDGKLMNL